MVNSCFLFLMELYLYYRSIVVVDKALTRPQCFPWPRIQSVWKVWVAMQRPHRASAFELRSGGFKGNPWTCPSVYIIDEWHRRGAQQSYQFHSVTLAKVSLCCITMLVPQWLKRETASGSETAEEAWTHWTCGEPAAEAKKPHVELTLCPF